MPDTQRTSRADLATIQQHVTDIEAWFPVAMEDVLQLAIDYLAALDVLAWYADEANHEQELDGFTLGGQQFYSSLVDKDSGNRARAFLASTEGEQP